MRTMLYLNRWGATYHVIVARLDGDEEKQLHSRVCMTLEEARQLAERWKQKYGIAAEDIRDNSGLDLNDVLGGATADFSPDRN